MTIFRSRYFRQGTSRATSQDARRPATTWRDGVDRSVAADWENPTLIDGSITKDQRKADGNRQASRGLIEHSDNFHAGYETSQSTAWGAGIGVIDGGKTAVLSFRY